MYIKAPVRVYIGSLSFHTSFHVIQSWSFTTKTQCIHELEGLSITTFPPQLLKPYRCLVMFLGALWTSVSSYCIQTVTERQWISLKLAVFCVHYRTKEKENRTKEKVNRTKTVTAKAQKDMKQTTPWSFLSFHFDEIKKKKKKNVTADAQRHMSS